MQKGLGSTDESTEYGLGTDEGFDALLERDRQVRIVEAEAEAEAEARADLPPGPVTEEWKCPELLEALPEFYWREHLVYYLDGTALSNLMSVNGGIRSTIIGEEVWLIKLRDEFGISLDLCRILAEPWLVYQRLKNLENCSTTESPNLYRQMRYQIIDPSLSPYSHPWIFFPYMSDCLDDFKKQLDQDGSVFQEYYLDLACQVGNLDFVQFMVQDYHFKPNQRNFESACRSGNIGLVKYFIQKLDFYPDKKALNEASRSRRLDLVKYLIETFSLRPVHQDLVNAAYTGSLELVSYYRNTFNLVPRQQVCDCAINSGSLELIRSLPIELSSVLETRSFYEHRLSLPVVRHLEDRLEGFVSSVEHRIVALEQGQLDLFNYLKDYTLTPDQFMACALSGDVEFVDNIIKEYDLKPTISWLRVAVLSGSLPLVKYFVTKHHLDPSKLDFDELPERYRYEGDRYFVGPLGMLKYLVEERGGSISLCAFRFEDFWRVNNLHTTAYLITERGYEINKNKENLFGLTEEFEGNPLLGGFRNPFLDGGVFEELFAMGARVRLENAYFPLKIEEKYLRGFSSSPFLRSFKVRSTFRFQSDPEDLAMVRLDERFLVAFCLLVRERLSSYSAIEISPPCSRKNGNVKSILEQSKRYIGNKKKKTKMLFVPFSLDEKKERWQLLVLDFSKNTASVFNSSDLLFCRRDDEAREFEEDWDYSNRDDYREFSSEHVLQEHYGELLDSVDTVFGLSMNRSYCQTYRQGSSHWSGFVLLMNLVKQSGIPTDEDQFKGEAKFHPFDSENGGRRLSRALLDHWQNQILGLLFLKLDSVPSLLEQESLLTNGGDQKELAADLKGLFYEEDGSTPKILYCEEIGRISKVPSKKFIFIKEAFLHTFGFDGYKVRSYGEEFSPKSGWLTPAFPDKENESNKFSAGSLTLFMALLTFFGFPARPEKVSIEEGVVLTWRQVLRNFFGGWNPIKYHKGSGQWNIQGKVLWNILLLPIKAVIFLIKLVTIPLKIALNIFKFIFIFTPLVAARYFYHWASHHLRVGSRKSENYAHIFKVIPFLLHTLPGFIMGIIGSVGLAFAFMGSIMFAPEKMLKIVWNSTQETFDNGVLKILAGVLSAAFILLLTAITWVAMGGLLWGLVLPAFPSVLGFLTSISNIPLVASAISLVKGAFVSVMALIPEGIQGLVLFASVCVAGALVAIGSRIADELSDAWARWQAPVAEWKNKSVELELLESQDVVEMVENQDVLDLRAQRVDEHAEKMLERFSDDSGPETLLGTEAGLTTDPELSAFFPSFE